MSRRDDRNIGAFNGRRQRSTTHAAQRSSSAQHSAPSRSAPRGSSGSRAAASSSNNSTTASRDYWSTVLNPTHVAAPRAGAQRGTQLRGAQPPTPVLRCPQCTTICSTGEELAQHRQHRHRVAARAAPVAPRVTPAARPFVCDCGQTFTQNSHLNQHKRTVHQQLRPFQCQECPRAFGKRHDLDSHISAVHDNERPYQCDICGRSFNKRSNLTRHVEKVHSGNERSGASRSVAGSSASHSAAASKTMSRRHR